jgi:fluoride exporter
MVFHRRYLGYLFSIPTFTGAFPPTMPFSQMNSLLPWCAVGLGAAIGAMARYAFSLWVYEGWLGIVFINALGAGLFGFAWVYAQKYGWHVTHHPWATFVFTGLCGGFTTFSSYVFYLVQQTHHQQWGLVAFHILGSHVLGVLLFWLGTECAKRLV